MKTSKILALSLLGITLLTSSCKKDKTTTPIDNGGSPTTTINTDNRQQLIKNLSSQLEIYTIDATIGGTFYGSKGTKIQISPAAFVNANNQVVTGSVTIKMKEALTKKDMILNNAAPMSNGKPLVSGGEIYFSAWQNGQPLKKNPSINGINVNIPISGTPDYQMGLFYAQGDDDLSTDNLNWTTASDTVSVVPDTSSVSNGGVPLSYYNYYPDSLMTNSMNWANCDYFWNDPNPKTTITFNLNEQFDNSNTVLYLSLNGANVLFNIYSTTNFALTQNFEANNIPINKNFTLIAISYNNGNYYYHSMPVASSLNLNVSVPPLSISSISQINNNLTLLP